MPPEIILPHTPEPSEMQRAPVNVVRSTSEAAAERIKRGILLWLVVQNSGHTLLLRYVRSRDVPHMFYPSVAVFFTELVKLVICVVAVFIDSGGVTPGVRTIKTTLLDGIWDTCKVGVLAFVYTMQNNLFYVAASHLDAGTFMITSQLKILTTAMFAVVVLRKSLRPVQWLALFLLFVGVSIVQLESTATTTAKPATATDRVENPFLGFMAVISACTLSGFAGIYFEKMLKDAAAVSLWMRNVQLAVCAVPISLITAFSKDGDMLTDDGLLYGFDGIVWFTVLWYGIGGLSVAVCIKYADNILKNFATSVAIISSTILSMFFFSFVPTLKFAGGASLVIGSIFLYSSPAPKPVAKPEPLTKL